MLKRSAEAETSIYSLKGDARLRINSPGAKGTTDLYVAVSRPALIHLEVLNFFGQPEAILTSDGKSFTLFQTSENKYYRGPATPRNVSRLLPVVLPAQAVVAIMLGGAPRIAIDGPTLSVTPDRRAYLIGLKQGAATQTLWIDPSTYRVLKSELRGNETYDLVFDDFKPRAHVMLPTTIRLAAPLASTTLEVTYKDDVVENQTLSANLFKSEPPPHASIINVDENGIPW